MVQLSCKSAQDGSNYLQQVRTCIVPNLRAIRCRKVIRLAPKHWQHHLQACRQQPYRSQRSDQAAYKLQRQFRADSEMKSCCRDARANVNMSYVKPKPTAMQWKQVPQKRCGIAMQPVAALLGAPPSAGGPPAGLAALLPMASGSNDGGCSVWVCATELYVTYAKIAPNHGGVCASTL